MTGYRRGMLLLPLTLVMLTGLALAQAPKDEATKKDDPGELAFNSVCGTCHTLRPGDNRLGPHLSGIIGRKAGTVENYANYSSTMKDSDIVWDEKTLDKFIENPEGTVSNNNMKPFAGVPEAEQRSKILAFLKACNECGPECPAPKKCQPQKQGAAGGSSSPAKQQ
jgi:cytochrome c